MKTGVSYMSHHNPKHIQSDIRDMKSLELDDVWVCCQENDFIWFDGKLKFTPAIAKDHGLRPGAIFWGALNLFGGGRSSQFLLEHPEGFQRKKDGSHVASGCYTNPLCVGRIEEMIDIAVENGFQSYFVDEPTPLACYCPACRAQYREWYDADLENADLPQEARFRQRCVHSYVKTISDYCKTHHPGLETVCCIMPSDSETWEAVAGIESLDNLGTDIYWVNNDRDVNGMVPIVEELDTLCKTHAKTHHEWLQCWAVRSGREERIVDQGEVLIARQPDALYVWAWKAQIGTTETCEDPQAAWRQVESLLQKAKRKD